MINGIISGISRALSEEFKGYEIYKERVEQGLKEPCFSIECIRSNERKFLHGRYYTENFFCVYFFGRNKRELHEVERRLYDCLEYIIANDVLIHGTKMKAEITSDVLAFMVNYNFFIYKKNENAPMMTNLSYSTAKKKEV